jgi:hypothetical protein
MLSRIEFVILRMDLSPCVALHGFSRCRSYARLQAGERLPEEDLHLSEPVSSQTHFPSFSRRGGRDLKKNVAKPHCWERTGWLHTSAGMQPPRLRPLRLLRDIFLMAQPPLLEKEGNKPDSAVFEPQHFLRRSNTQPTSAAKTKIVLA